MLKLVNPNIKFPELYPPINERIQATATTASSVIVDGFKIRKHKDYFPQLGMQEDVCKSEANLIFMCGQGTSGKTYSLYFKALGGIDKYGFTARIISFQAKDSQKGTPMLRDGIKMCGEFANCEVTTSSGFPTFYWKKWNSNLQLIHANFNGDNPDEREAFEEYAKKQQASLIMIDEATAIKQFGLFTFWFMRNRDDSGMIPQMILTFNPRHKHWTTQMLKDAGYLGDDWYLRKDMIGKIRYFYNKGDNPSQIVWGDTKEEVVKYANIILKPEDRDAGLTVYDYVKSFTVFTGTAADNRELVNATRGQSIANLHAVGGTQRAVVGEAYFGPIEEETNEVTRQMIHNLWENPLSDDQNMYATMDISSGGKGNDKCPMVIWRGLQIIAIQFFSGQPMEIAPWIQRQLNTYGVPITNFAYDATGHGYWMQGLTSGMAVTSNARAKQELDENGNPVQAEQYFNLRSQLLGKMKVLFERGDISCAIDKYAVIPYGKNGETRQFIDILFDEINVFVTQQRMKKIYYKSKDEYKDRYKHSPDLMDAITLRAVFELDARPKRKPKPIVNDDVYTNYFNNRPRSSYGRRTYPIKNF